MPPSIFHARTYPARLHSYIIIHRLRHTHRIPSTHLTPSPSPLSSHPILSSEAHVHRYYRYYVFLFTKFENSASINVPHHSIEDDHHSPTSPYKSCHPTPCHQPSSHIPKPLQFITPNGILPIPPHDSTPHAHSSVSVQCILI